MVSTTVLLGVLLVNFVQDYIKNPTSDNNRRFAVALETSQIWCAVISVASVVLLLAAIHQLNQMMKKVNQSYLKVGERGRFSLNSVSILLHLFLLFLTLIMTVCNAYVQIFTSLENDYDGSAWLYRSYSILFCFQAVLCITVQFVFWRISSSIKPVLRRAI